MFLALPLGVGRQALHPSPRDFFFNSGEYFGGGGIAPQALRLTATSSTSEEEGQALLLTTAVCTLRLLASSTAAHSLIMRSAFWPPWSFLARKDAQSRDQKSCAQPYGESEF